ncbi:MAG: uroporphyrinogen decarboxylase [Candidatus Delongbacteria bacterium]|nr:uroporphyrinogen decarboxylase [Candidatus Delongbacteria bacterium]
MSQPAFKNPEPATGNNLYLRALRGEPLPAPPVWLMRQAGRYLPEYLAVREQHSFLEVCHTPELACEVTLQPIRRFHFDVSILFSDILVPLVPMGAELSFGAGHGPQIANPVRSAADVAALRSIEPRESLKTVLEAIRLIRRELPDDVALVGFAGAPFTLSSYLVEGGKPEPFAQLKSLMYQDPAAFMMLQHKLGEMVTATLTAMVEAGADAVQLFDTWAGILSQAEYRHFCLPTLQQIFQQLQEQRIPTTYFARNGFHLLEAVGETGANVQSLDWRIPLTTARTVLGEDAVLQGNLDPTVLLGDESTIRREVRRVLTEGGGRNHIFNLGHGILPLTPIASVEILLSEIREGSK